ncbi:MBL fold metallo-hydrolase [Tenacibaculum aiptasiae]|uniref:MBL fold metallo-hydrolase n=1 Tax=Tenacibaculum aiptasiae TaxID=426481 RepID=UPI00232F0FAF|nr:MBL fold metallo-hydrolase [Tenacibaculum aiptasiae]
MRGDFKFYNVGQGCFYGGAIKYNNNEFVVVYDCGSVTKGNPLAIAIKNFKQEYNHIDLLIISHFDKDHVNGIEELIKGTKVGQIIMPYMPLWYRIALIAKTGVNTNSYVSMLLNPTAYFLEGEFDVDRIYYIDQSPSDSKVDLYPNDTSNEPEKDFDDILGDVQELFLNDFKNDNDAKDSITKEEPELNNNDVFFLPPNPIFRLNQYLWEFVFYHKQTKNQTDISDFEDEVKDYMKVENISNIKDLFTYKRRTAIKKIYEDNIDKNINYSSLCVYHSPKHKVRFSHVIKDTLRDTIKDYSTCLKYWWQDELKSGTLLTGDQFLKRKKDFNAFYVYYMSRLNKVLFFQVPHHGSYANWKMLPNEIDKHKFRYFVINCGYGRKYHPDTRVLTNLLQNNIHPIINDEFTLLEYSLVI